MSEHFLMQGVESDQIVFFGKSREEMVEDVVGRDGCT